MSIVKGARNMDKAKKFYDWALTPDVQKLGAAGQAVPGAVEQGRRRAAGGARTSPTMKLIDYDFAKYGKSAESASACSRSGTTRWARCRNSR